MSKKNKKIDIGQTLETNDLYLPHNKKTQSKKRPVIVVDKNFKDELVVVPGSTQDTPNTTKYGKHGISYYRHNIEIVDNENNPIKFGDKFWKTPKSSKLPENDTNRIRDHVINHTKFSSENRNKYNSFKNRYKKNRD